MLAAYGVDVLDPRTSLRRVHVLLERLPPHARRGGEQWSTESELLATLVDAVSTLTWVTLRANGSKASMPKPLPRPKPRHHDKPRAVAPRPRRALGEVVDDGEEPTRSWGDAVAAIAATDGVRVRHG